MRNIIVAVMILVAMIFVLFALAFLLYKLASAAGAADSALTTSFWSAIATVAAGVVGLLSKIHDALEVRSAKLALEEQHIKSLDEASINTINAFVLATIMTTGMLFFATFLTGFLMGLVTGSNTDQSQQLLLIGVVLALPLQIIFLIYIGFWIGTRSRGFGFLVATGSVVLGFFVVNILGNSIFGFFFLDSKAFNENFGMAKPDSFGMVLMVHMNIFNIVNAILYLISVIIGTWWGRRRRLMRYLGFILAILPQDTRRTIVEVARDEALRVGTQRRDQLRRAVAAV